MIFEHDGKVFEVGNLTVAQVELVSELIHDYRERLFADRVETARASGDLVAERAVWQLPLLFSDLLHEIERKRKLSYFIALCVCEQGCGFDEKQLTALSKSFKALPSDVAEAVLRRFFTSETFAKRFIRDYLMEAVNIAADGLFTPQAFSEETDGL